MKDSSRRDKDLCPDELRPVSAAEKDEEIGDIHFDASNFSGALDYYAKARKTALELSLTGKVAYLDLRIASCQKGKGDYSTAIECARSAKSAFRKEKDFVGLGKAYCLEGVLHAEIGSYRKGRRLCETGQKLLKGTGEFLELGRIENWLGTIHTRLGNISRAREYFEDALTAFRSIRHDEGVSQVLNNLGVLQKNLSEWRQAAGFFEKALRISEKTGNFGRVATFALNLGIVHFRLGEWESAQRHFARSLQVCTQTGNRGGVVRNRLAMANIDLRKREWEAAEAAYREVLTLSRALGYKREETLALEFLGELELARGNSDAAFALLKEAEPIALGIAPRGDLIMEVLRRRAEVHLARDEFAEAMEAAEQAAEIARSLGDRCEEALSKRATGIALWYEGEWDKGWRTIEDALAVLTTIGERFETARTLLLAGRAVVAKLPTGDVSAECADRAVSFLRQAMGVFLSFDVKGWAALATAELAKLYLTRKMPDESLSYVEEAEKLLADVEEGEIYSELAAVRAALEEAFVSSTLSSSGEFKILEELGKLLGGDEDPEKMLDELMQLILARSDADRGLIAFVSPNVPPRIWTARRVSPGEATSIVRSLEEALVLENGASPRVVTSVSSDKIFSQLSAFERVQSFVVVPLSLPSGQNGLVYADRLSGNRLGPFKQRELNLLAVISGIATLAAVEAERAARRNESAAYREGLRLRSSFDGIVTENEEMLAILSLVEKVGASSATILVQGETGTGKALIAEALHSCSPRGEGPFIPISCSAIPESLLESELFGHVQGAFTGAIRDKRGLFEEAEGGTVFLDEVAKTTRSVQAKLLHFLDKKEIRAVGSTKWKKVDARIICATNLDLRQLIKDGAFLEDLYYRLSDITISVPPLRERRDDIPLLVEHYLREFGGNGETRPRPVSRGAMQALMDYDWPGNVRELEKTVKRMLVLAGPDGELTSELLPREISHQEGGVIEGGSLRTEVERTERRVIGETLEKHGWNKARAAKSLGISYPTLLKKIKELSIDRRHRSRG
ncbi:MAG: sigma 54-interacting transcriptional regulator [Candidatus Eiseniibacteriota bacterium]|nr:MAG: sigma 54-interacting transcriptional regulator [Candidatus Eisenbacteria bacterium]